MRALSLGLVAVAVAAVVVVVAAGVEALGMKVWCSREGCL